MASRDLILQRIAALDKQIEEKECAAIEAEVELTSGAKGVITRWKNKMAELEEQLVKLDETKPALPPQIITTPSSSGQSRRRDAVSLMSRDILDQPELCPKLDVAVFCRRMGAVWNTHCKKSRELEQDFLTIVEQRLCQDYRHSFQTNNSDKPCLAQRIT